ncbi:MAG: PAS domain-containing protein [Dehalococcoidia bacterium]|nr:PAS domain-containing protein [Dehalococcoidia bacterium]
MARETLSFLALDLLLAVVIAAFAYMQLTRTERVEELILQRTAELEDQVRARTTISSQLLRSQEMLAAAQTVAHVGSWQWNVATDDLTWSDELYRILDRQPDQFDGRLSELLDLVHPDDRDTVQATMERAVAGAEDLDIDYRIVRSDGAVRTVTQSAAVTRGDNGQPVSILGTIHDITDRVAAEHALAHGNQRLEQAQRIAHVGHWEWDIVTNDLAWSDEIYRIFGLQPQEFDATYPAFLEYIHPDDRPAVEAAVGRAVAGQEPYAVDHRVVHPDGTIRFVHESGLITWSDEGQPLRMLGVVNDITDRVEAERALNENNSYLNTVVNTMQGALLITNNDSNIVLANQAASDMLGYSADELARIDPGEFAHPDDQARILERRQERARGRESEPNFRRRMIRKDGSAVWVESSPSILWLNGEVAGLVAEYRDITHQLEAERQIRDSAARLELAQSMAHVGSWGQSLTNKRDHYWSDELYRLYGIEPGTIPYSPTLYLDYLHPDDHDYFEERFGDFREGLADSYEAQARFIGADSVERVLLLQAERTRDQDGNPLSMEGTAQDVTELVRAQAALAESTSLVQENNEYLHTVVDTVQAALIITDQDGNIVLANQAAANMLDYSTDELLNLDLSTFHHPDDALALEHRRQQRLAGVQPELRFRRRMVRKDGSAVWVEASPSLLQIDGEPAGLVAEYRDITHQVKAEAQLQEAAARLELAQSMAHVGSWGRNLTDGERYWSAEFHRLLGYDPTEDLPTRERYREHIHPDDRERYLAEIRDFRAEATDSYDAQARFVGADGVLRVLQVHGERTRDQDGNPLREDGTGLDITELTRAEAALSESAARLELAQSMARLGSWGRYLDSDDGYWSDEMYRLLGYEPTAALPPPDHFIKHLHSGDRERFELVHQSFSEQEIDTYEIQARFIGADGIERILLLRGERTRDQDGNPLRIEGTAQDVTAKVQAERQITEAQFRLQENNQYLHTVVDTVQAALIISDPQENIILANQAAADMLGYTLDELKQIEPRAFVHPGDAAAIAARSRARAQGIDSEPNFRRRMVRKDGSSVWVEATPSIFWLDGKIAGRVAEYRDITHQIKAESQLQEAAARLELAQSMAHVGSWGRSLVSDDRYWSDEMFRILGYEPDSVQPSPGLMQKHLHPDDREPYSEALRAFREKRADIYDAQARFIGVDGVERVLHMHGERTRNEQGNPIRYDGTGQDITAQVAAEEQLETARQQLTAELERAGAVQRAFQPGTNAKFQMLSVAGQCLPAQAVGGDFFDWAPFDDGGVRVTIGDVMGKGIPAAIFMSMTQTALRASGRPDARSGSGPAGQLSRVNRALYPYLDSADSFVTAFTAEVDRDGHFSYADAGHGHALLRRQDGTFIELRSAGLPIGVAANTTYASANAQLRPGDTLLLMTDGLRDLLDDAAESGQWTDLLGTSVDCWDDPQQTAAEIVHLAQQSAPESGPNDDLTIIALSYEGIGAAPDETTTPTGQLELTVPPTLGALAAAEADLQLFFRRLHVGDQRSGAMLTAVHEILANIVEHAKPTADVGVAIEVSAESIAVTTRDDGRLFDADEATRAAEVATDRGRGLSMCQILLDRNDYSRTNGHNQWHLEMQLTPTPPAVAQ